MLADVNTQYLQHLWVCACFFHLRIQEHAQNEVCFIWRQSVPVFDAVCARRGKVQDRGKNDCACVVHVRAHAHWVCERSSFINFHHQPCKRTGCCGPCECCIHCCCPTEPIKNNVEVAGFLYGRLLCCVLPRSTKHNSSGMHSTKCPIDSFGCETYNQNLAGEYPSPPAPPARARQSPQTASAAHCTSLLFFHSSPQLRSWPKKKVDATKLALILTEVNHHYTLHQHQCVT